jgi:hypothetical protein
MAKTRLTTEKMTSLSNVLLTELRDKLEKIPQVAAMLPDIEAVHKDLVIARDSPPPINEQLRDLIQQMFALDLTHDRNFRAGYWLVKSQQSIAAALNRELDEAILDALEKTLYPHSLSGTLLKYEEQEGAALLLEKSLDDNLKTRLKTITTTIEGGEVFSLLSFVEQHIDSAKTLGIAERQKKKLQEQEIQSTAPSAVDERKARQGWIEVMSGLESNLSLALRRKTATQPDADEILRGLREAEAKADQEHAKQKAKEAEERAAKAKKQTTPTGTGKD